MDTLCFDGWSKENGNESGRCCCNCKWQRPISAHPWNKKYGPPLEGSIMNVVGWGCTVPEFSKITFFEFEHGMCEVHDWKKDG